MEPDFKQANLEAALQLLEQARLPADEVNARLAQACSPAYWAVLNPQLSVNHETDVRGFEVTTVDALRQRELLAQLSKEGYFQMEPLLSKPVIERMREGVEVLRKAGWSPVFAFVYDEFWQVANLPSLVQLLSAALGPGYRRVPHIWGHYVPPQGGAGWRPHMDSVHRAERLTVWIPLSDATLTGSCMFLIPKNLTPRAVADGLTELQNFGIDDLNALLKNTRPLPVQAGALLGWEHNVIHWGGAAWQTSEPRISITMEFMREGATPSSDEYPLLDAHSLPSFAQRLHLIGKAIVAYQRFEPLQIRYLELAQRLVADEFALPESGGPGRNV